jgi:hypothetical protein
MTNKPGFGAQPAPNAGHKAGDANGGFEASADKRNRILRVRLWGLWDTSIAEQFVASVAALGTELSGSPWASLVDARKFMVQSPQILQLRQESLNRAAALGCTKMATLVESAAYSLQFKRLAGTSHIPSETFHDEISAMMWLRKA